MVTPLLHPHPPQNYPGLAFFLLKLWRLFASVNENTLKGGGLPMVEALLALGSRWVDGK